MDLPVWSFSTYSWRTTTLSPVVCHEIVVFFGPRSHDVNLLKSDVDVFQCPVRMTTIAISCGREGAFPLSPCLAAFPLHHRHAAAVGGGGGGGKEREDGPSTVTLHLRQRWM